MNAVIMLKRQLLVIIVGKSTSGKLHNKGIAKQKCDSSRWSE